MARGWQQRPTNNSDDRGRATSTQGIHDHGNAEVTPDPMIHTGLVRLHQAAGNRAVGRALQAARAGDLSGSSHADEAAHLSGKRAAQDTATGSEQQQAAAIADLVSRGGDSWGYAPPGGGTPLPPELRERLEQTFQIDLRHVRVHRSPDPRALGVKAFTYGNHIVIDPRRLHDPFGRDVDVIGHEVGHVLQQQYGLARALAGPPVVDDRELEDAADRAGAAAATERKVAPPGAAAPGVVQPAIQAIGLPKNIKELLAKLPGPLGKRYRNKLHPAPPAVAPAGGGPPPASAGPSHDEIKDMLRGQAFPDEPDLSGLRKVRGTEEQHGWMDNLFENVKGNLEEGESPEDMDKLSSDYKRIQRLLHNPGKTEKHLQPLEQLIGQEEDTRGHRGALGRALASQQEKFGFSTNQRIPLGILDSDEFLGLAGQGLQPKDIGAGLSHGERSHELQWSAIMAKFEHDMGKGRESKRWHHTPLELMTKLNDHRLKGGDDVSLQGYLMDKPSVAEAEGYQRPDTITHRMIELAESNRSKSPEEQTLPKLSERVRGHFEKRLSMRAHVEGQPGGLQEAYAKYKTAKGWTRPARSDGQPGLLLEPPPARRRDEETLEDRLQAQRDKWFPKSS